MYCKHLDLFTAISPICRTSRAYKKWLVF